MSIFGHKSLSFAYPKKFNLYGYFKIDTFQGQGSQGWEAQGQGGGLPQERDLLYRDKRDIG